MHYNLEIGIIEKINQRECKLTTYHITHTHSSENCFSGNDEIMSLWKQIENNAQNNNVEINFFKVNPTEHIFFILLETDDYSNIEKTIGQCKKTGDFRVTPVMEQTFNPK